MFETDPELSQSLKVKVFKPKAIVLGFHGTIAPVDWEDNSILPYIRNNLIEYLKKNFDNNCVKELLPKLRQESFDQHFVYDNTECPVIPDEDSDISDQIKSIKEFIVWLIDNNRETHESTKLQDLVWKHGLDSRVIKVPLFKDVVPALKSFKNDYKFKISLFSTVEQQLCRKLLTNTEDGDINAYFDHIFDKTTGDSKDVKSFEKIANTMSVPERDILYVTDYGQSAKCAKQLDIQSLLMIRPKNRKIREYYSLNFSSIYSLLDIQFVERKVNSN